MDINKGSLTGHQVFHWPEFQALAKRLGVDMNRKTKRLVIVLDIDEMATIDHTYVGVEHPNESTT